jgi:aspartyl-tRNA(Asn)/glutamyl-tRNA(Gln) amidotransferase subunit C
MNIDKDTVEEIAHLARLEFDEKEQEQIINDMNNMLLFVNKLNEVDTSTIEPLIYMSDETNILREDEVTQEITQEQALKNAPKKDSDYFKVPKVIDKQ